MSILEFINIQAAAHDVLLTIIAIIIRILAAFILAIVVIPLQIIELRYDKQTGGTAKILFLSALTVLILIIGTTFLQVCRITACGFFSHLGTLAILNSLLILLLIIYGVLLYRQKKYID